jgi:threonyl-tRNA synthetase
MNLSRVKTVVRRWSDGYLNTFYSAQPREDIVITMPDGSERKGKSWQTSPMDVAKEVSKSLSERIVIAKVNTLSITCDPELTHSQVNGDVWDLERPLEGPCKLELLDFEHPEGTLYRYQNSTELTSSAGKRVFWHSSAHVLGEAAERHYGCHLCIGPPTDDGFFYEMAIEERY